MNATFVILNYFLSPSPWSLRYFRIANFATHSMIILNVLFICNHPIKIFRKFSFFTVLNFVLDIIIREKIRFHYCYIAIISQKYFEEIWECSIDFTPVCEFPIFSCLFDVWRYILCCVYGTCDALLSQIRFQILNTSIFGIDFFLHVSLGMP